MDTWDIVANVTMLIFMLAFVVKDILWLRAITVLGSFVEIIYFYFASSEPLWIYISWDIGFILINGYQIGIILKETYAHPLTLEEERIYQDIFSSISKSQFVHLLKIAEWRHASPEELFSEQGQKMDTIMLIDNGMAEIFVNDEAVGYLKDGQFIGEMSFLSGQPASATIRTAMETSYLAWSQEKLHALMSDDAGIESCIQNLFSKDLVRKLNG